MIFVSFWSELGKVGELWSGIGYGPLDEATFYYFHPLRMVF